ncbi:hypothetical protein ERX35_007945 [Macrococcus equipercicus]|uniref:Uncharacterized protein n=2 Tax=Macrococcus equipercicus TaxID=69967 RepID=A0ABQ6R7R6_9STAP|nr:hypothetical protein ERX35_007945 [Macrococcus equipercicus]
MSSNLYSGIYKADDIEFRVYGRHVMIKGHHFIRIEAGLEYPVDRETLREEKQSEQVVDILSESAERSEININDLALKLATNRPQGISSIGMTTEEAIEAQKLVDENFKKTFTKRQGEVDETI